MTDFAAAGYQLLPDDERPPAPDPVLEAAWQANVQAVADAKRAAADAFAAWQQAEADLFACPVWVERARAVRMPDPCDCHWPALVAARDAYVAAKDGIAPAIDRFKAGVE